MQFFCQIIKLNYNRYNYLIFIDKYLFERYHTFFRWLIKVTKIVVWINVVSVGPGISLSAEALVQIGLKLENNDYLSN